MTTENKYSSIVRERKTIKELAEMEHPPLNISVIPNYMGINLCCVEGMSWTRQDDGQLVDLTIHFNPAKPEYKS